MPRAVGQLRRMSVCNGLRKMTLANVFMAALLLLPRVNTKTEHASVDGTQYHEDTSLHSLDIFSIPAPDTQDNTINWTDSDKQNLENSTENEIFVPPNPGSVSAAEVEETADAGIVYQVLGPGRYTALEGPLNVTVLRGSNRKRTFIGPQHSEFLQLSARLLHSSDELGSRTIGPVVEGVHYSTSLPCGLVSVGGTHVIRLSRNDTVLAETIVLVRWPKVVVLPPLNGEPISARLESKCRPLPSERPLQTCGELLHHGSVSSLSPVILPLQHQLLHDGSEIKPSNSSKTNNDSVNIQAIKDMLYNSNEETPLTLQEKRKLISLSQAEEKPKLIKTASYSLIQSYSEISNNTVHDSMPAETGRKEKAQQQTKFCEPPQVRGTDEDGSGRVVDRVRLTSLYSSGESDLWFDCRHLMDGEVYSARITVQLPASPVLGSSPRFTVQWSTMVSLNVTVRYMQECHGSASVRVGQRTCRSTLNKIRVYARVPFNVDSVNPPVEEKYLAEYRVRRLPVNIPCSLFSEGPSEYCFVYVSIASSGAVFEVARVCRSTLRPGGVILHRTLT
ncbi:uncharacterized protein LOC108679349 [Hyalella azteca]|uniref:Uncharacterized protein LOC108679349 n=1 Tax=Hyalella azteca TaxID=294128 RepID=A0A8B7PBI3_HYAAZ|nr:uncharacterized protein LOC108679349 [Hyalella azteca]